MDNLDYNHFWPEVLQVVPTDNFGIFVYFNDGSVRFFDVRPLLRKGTVFEPMTDLQFFKDRLTIINDTVAWDLTGDADPRKCVDLDPFVLFEQPCVADPLEQESA